MKDLNYVLGNFFTHKDFLVSPELIPGTLFTPLHFLFEAILVLLIVTLAVYVAKHKKLIRPVFIGMWILLLIWEVVIIWWDSTACRNPGFDIRVNLSLYPCSIFMVAMPLVLWGRGFWKQAAYGYIFTLGFLGALINFLYPFSKLTDYSCLSFIAFHTFFYHGSMLFTYLVLLLSGMHSYRNVGRTLPLLAPSALSLVFSLPANLVNYLLDADYMYFRGKLFLVSMVFKSTPEPVVTLILYSLYIIIPALFYLPAFLRSRMPRQAQVLELAEELESEMALPGLQFRRLFTN